MVQINANVDERIVRQFRHIIYTKDGLRKGDFKKALEEAMIDYIQKYGDSEVSEKAEMAKSLRKEEE